VIGVMETTHLICYKIQMVVVTIEVNAVVKIGVAALLINL